MKVKSLISMKVNDKISCVSFPALLSNLNFETDDNNLIFNEYLSNYTILPKTKKLLVCLISGTRVLR